MTCGCGCVSRANLCIGLNNDKRFVFSIYDQDGDEFDVSAATDISFSVSDGIEVGGNVLAGGTVRFEKTLLTSGVAIAGTGYQVVVDVTDADTITLVKSRSYYDLTVTTSSGLKYTVSAGVFTLISTNAGA